MSGNKIGGRKAAKTNVERYGADFYQRIGRMGGAQGRGVGYKGGFASDIVGTDGLTGRQRAKLAGAKGGKMSRRGETVSGRLDEYRETILEHMQGGESMKSLAEELGCSYSSLRRWCRENIW